MYVSIYPPIYLTLSLQRATYGVLPIRDLLKFGISIFEFTLNFDPIHGVCNPLERRDGGQQILPKS